MTKQKLSVLILILMVSPLTMIFGEAQDSFYNEAPILTELVSAGELPPVDDRLPNNPVLVNTIDEIGTFGGTWRVGNVQGDRTFLIRLMGYEGLVRWDPQWTRVVPNIAQAWEVNEDSKRYTFYLREGMRWSDGMPFTVDDIMFWYEDIRTAEGLDFQLLRTLDTTPYTIEKVDDYTIAFVFESPNGLLLQVLSDVVVSAITQYPKHYLSQFHPRYNEEIDTLIEEAGVSDWTELFRLHAPECCAIIPGTPTLFAWMLEEGTEYDNVGTSYYAVRNPYYWKIDTDFNQLPYIDQIEFQVVEERADILDLAIEGKIDMQFRNIALEAFLPENQASGGYDSFALIPTASSQFTIFLNLSHDDPVKREILQNRDFRIGLSHAIDRQSIAEIFGEDLSPTQPMPLQASIFYNEEHSTQFTGYDVDLANQYLDQAGYSERNADGIRLGPDGNPIEFDLILPDPHVGLPIDGQPILEQVQANWMAVGIRVNAVQVERVIIEDAIAITDSSHFNQYDMHVWAATGGFEAILFPPLADRMAPRWHLWLRNPDSPEAEQPPARLIEQYNLFQQAQATSDPEEQNALVNEILAISAEEFFAIGTVTAPERFGIVKPNFRNVPDFMFTSWTYPNPAPTNPAQYFIQQ